MSNVNSVGQFNPSFIGVGLSYPRRLDATGSRDVIASNEDLVKQSMIQILETDVTERPFVTSNGVPFGTRIKRVLFDSVETAISVVGYEVQRALTIWEPRIIVDSVEVIQFISATSGLVCVEADTSFRFRSTNRPDNLVVPFYLQGNPQ